MSINIPSIFNLNPNSHYMQPGSVAFIPGWIMLFITIIALALTFPKFFSKTTKKMNQNQSIINPLFLAFIIGSLMPALDDIFAFFFGPPFAHHSLFHSIAGLFLTYICFRIVFSKEVATFAFFGNLSHIIFNFYLDYTTLFYPLTFREYGLSDIIRLSTYWLKIINYPIIFILFIYSVTKYLRSKKKVADS